MPFSSPGHADLQFDHFSFEAYSDRKHQRPVPHSWVDSKNIPGCVMDFSRPQHHKCPIPVDPMWGKSHLWRAAKSLFCVGKAGTAMHWPMSAPPQPGQSCLSWAHTSLGTGITPKSRAALQLRAHHSHVGCCGFCKMRLASIYGAIKCPRKQSQPQTGRIWLFSDAGHWAPLRGIQTLPVLAPAQNRRLLSYCHAWHQLGNAAAQTHGPAASRPLRCDLSHSPHPELLLPVEIHVCTWCLMQVYTF